MHMKFGILDCSVFIEKSIEVQKYRFFISHVLLKLMIPTKGRPHYDG